MNVFPAFIPLSKIRVVVVGDGPAAEAKARLFDGSPAELKRHPAARALDPETYEGARLAFIAVDSEKTAAAAAVLARVAGALVNVVDRPWLGDFQTPAIVDRTPVVCAIGTGGSSPVFATLLRNGIEARWPEGLGRVAELSGELQKAVRAAIPDPAARRAYWRKLMRSPAADAAMAGDLETARRLAIAAIEAPRAAGRVLILEAPAKPELLSLAAVRALAGADRIVAASDVPLEVTAFARRDAERCETASPSELAAWAEAGTTTAYVGGGECGQVLAAVQALGAPAERLPVAAP